MWASWTNAHPFAKSGRWSSPGADYDSSECVTADSAIKNDPDTGRPADPNAIYFKVTRWFRDFVVGRNVNFGHVLKSSGDEISVYGDASGSYSPGILWNKTVK